MLPSAGVILGPVSGSAGLGDESVAPPAAVTFRSVAFTLLPSDFCIAVWMRLVRVALVGDRFTPVRLYAACGDDISQGKRSHTLQTVHTVTCLRDRDFDRTLHLYTAQESSVCNEGLP